MDIYTTSTYALDHVPTILAHNKSYTHYNGRSALMINAGRIIAKSDNCRRITAQFQVIVKYRAALTNYC